MKRSDIKNKKYGLAYLITSCVIFALSIFVIIFALLTKAFWIMFVYLGLALAYITTIFVFEILNGKQAKAKGSITVESDDEDDEEEEEDEKFFIPFPARLKKSKTFVKVAYNEIKSELLAYGLKSRVSNKGDSFRLHRILYTRIVIAGKTLKLYMALNPNDYKDSTIPYKDASKFKKYLEIPFIFKVKSDLSVRRAKTLIEDMARENGLEKKEVILFDHAKEVTEGVVVPTRPSKFHKKEKVYKEASKGSRNESGKKPKEFISKPLLKQSIKSNFMLWLIMSLGSAGIFVVINLVVGTKSIFTNIDMNTVQAYIKDEDLNWLQILGLLEQMGFNLSRIQTMSQIDLHSVMNDLIYKITGVLLPMIYVMITCNKLVSAQVSDGSMAYILSTPTNRKTVVRTQYIFMLLSLVAMYLVITLGAYSTGAVGYFVTKPDNINFGTFTVRTLLYCFGSFAAMFALTGVCFGASCWFSKSSNSTAVGGGACILAFLCCILGLFGNKVFVSVGIGVEAMNAFNFLTIYTLIDTESMSNFAKAVTGAYGGIMSLKWLWEIAILAGIGGIGAYIGGRKFVKKDLPL